MKTKIFQDPEVAYEYYSKALKAAPSNAELKVKTEQYRLEASQFHIQKGRTVRTDGQFQSALAEFERALDIDPSSPVAEQEIRTTSALIGSKHEKPDSAPAHSKLELAEGPPELKPLSTSPINLKMSNDAKIIFETIGKLAGLTIVFDSDFPAHRINVELSNATFEQALDVVCMQSKAFWKPITQNIIFIVPDQAQKRRDYEEQLVQTFYLSNSVQTQDLTEIVTGLRQLLDLKHVQQLNSQNAIIIRDTPDKLTLAEKIIHDADHAKSEVIVQVEVLQARRDHVRKLGISPDGTATLAYAPPSSSSSTNTKAALGDLGHLATDYSVTLPGATANALLTDNTTRIIQNPELRSVDGQSAKLKVGDRVPVATGSFQAGSTGTNPLVNTQFQYIDVGVNADVTPRIHPDREVSLKVAIEVSSVTGYATIGGIQQPIISQRKIEHDIRLKEGEVSILGGLFERTDTKSISGWPGLAHIPIFRYFFSSDNVEHEENEVLILLTPRIVRLPGITQASLHPLSSGTESNIQVRHKESIESPSPASTTSTPPAVGNKEPLETHEEGRLYFEPRTTTLKVGQTVRLDLVIENVNDLFSVPLLFQYDPKVISIEDVHHGGFLSGGTQEVALVQHVDQERGQAVISATRQPNTPGVNGGGILISLTIRGIGAGTSSLSIVQVNAKDSKEKQLPIATESASLHVEQ